MFADLVKAAQHKYIKRVPKAGGAISIFTARRGAEASR